MSKVIEYKCPNCGGAIEFDIKSQKCQCPYCDAEFDANEFQSYNEDLANQPADEKLEWDESNLNEYSQEEAQALKAYHCDSCGAEIVADENTSATTCPYCSSPVILKGRLSGDLKPEYVIPFMQDKDDCKAALKKFLKGKLFLPNAFKTENKIEDVSGMYVPFWLYDADVSGRVKYKGEKTKTWTSGDYRYRETKYYSIVRDGNIGFDKIPVDGSKKMDDKMMESIEPFDFKEVKSFNSAYLSGHISERYDVDKEACRNRANDRIREGTIMKFRETIDGYDSVTYDESNLSLSNTSVHYALYPVWILISKWQDKEFKFAMNAQSGKFVGNLPLSKLKYFLFYLLFYVVSAPLLGVLSYFCQDPGDSRLLLSILFGFVCGFIAPTIFCEINRKKLKKIKWQKGANNYYRPESMHITYSRDFFLYKRVTKTRINNDHH